MNDEEKTEIILDAKIITDLVNGIEDFLISKDVRVCEALTALISILVIHGIKIGLSKPIILSQISNTWELNDPQNDHLIKKRKDKPDGTVEYPPLKSTI